MRRFSLSYLTCQDIPPPQAVRLAAEAGYQSVGLRLLPASPGGVAHRLMDDAGALAETLAAMHETGIEVFDLEIIRLDAQFDVSRYRRFLDIGAELGAKVILVAGDDPDESRLTASYAALCEAAAPYGLCADLEFMPQTELRDVQAATRVLRAVDMTNSGIIVDPLHFARCGASLADIANLEWRWIHYIQICDAPADYPATPAALNFTARCERLLPGEGDIDLAALFAVLPRDVPVSVEIPHHIRAPALGLSGWAKAGLAASQAVLQRVV